MSTCITETNDIAVPVRDGGLVSLVFGLAEYAEGEADKTFKTCKMAQISGRKTRKGMPKYMVNKKNSINITIRTCKKGIRNVN